MPMMERTCRLTAHSRVARPTRKRTRKGKGKEAEKEGRRTWECGSGWRMSGMEFEGGESMSIGAGKRKRKWMGKVK